MDFTIEIEVIPTGTLLAASGDAQNMAVLELKGLYVGLGYYARDKIILDTSDAVRYLFSGYCVNFHKSNPTSATTFYQSGMADANVLEIFNVLDQLPENVTGIAAIQTAIFVVTDDVSYSELENRFPDGVDEIQNARTILETAGIDISDKRLFSE